MHVVVTADAAGAACAAADLLSEWFGAGDGTVSFALAGGSTPAATYRELHDRDVEWERVVAWVGDERWVPPDHPDNNGAMARRALIDPVGARFLPVPWVASSAATAAATYEVDLRAVLSEADGQVRPDVVMLGMGADGHTLSLFPGTAALRERERLYVANWVPHLSTWRLTATFPLLDAARRLLVVVTGEGKAEAVAAVLEDSESELPMRRALDGGAAVTWIMDEAAASRMSDR